MAFSWGRTAWAAVATAAMMASAAPAQFYWYPPDFRGPPVKGDEPGIGLPLPGATAAELDAHLLWNMRAGLNVAALQCQFSPTLMTVPNYNALLAHHAKEFNAAFTTLGKYFTRLNKGKAGQTAFDQYTTRTYNGFSTLHAQLGFCQTAAAIGREALTRPKGQLGALAHERMREFRNSLVPASENVFTRVGIPTYPLPRMDKDCWTKRDELRPACQNWRPESLVAVAPAAAPALAAASAR